MKKTEEMGEFLKDILISLAEKSSDVFWIRSKDYQKQIYMSPVFEQIWGRKCSEVYEHPERWEEWLYLEDKKLLKESIARRNPQTKSTDVFYENYRIVRPDGEIRFITDTSFPIFDAENNLICFAGIAHDVTVDRRREQALFEAKEKAEANELKTMFLQNMSHDFKTPLNGIWGVAQLFDIKRNELSEEMQILLDAQITSIKRLNKMILAILEYSKVDSGTLEINREELDLFNIIENIIQNLSFELKNKSVDILMNYSSDLPHHFMGDSYCIHSIILNLMTNAVKFTKEGFILISIEISSRKENQAILKFQIKDTGEGIPADKLDLVFQRFYRLERSHKGLKEGSGIGLSLVKELVEKLNGKIGLESKIEQGTIFTVELPIEIIDSTSFISDWEEKYANVRILVVSDQITSMVSQFNQLKKISIEEVSSDSVIEKLEESIEKKNPYQILIIDDQIKTDPITLIQILDKNKKFKSLMKILSLHPRQDRDKQWYDSAREAGCFDFIYKPVLRTELDKKMIAAWKKWQNQSVI